LEVLLPDRPPVSTDLAATFLAEAYGREGELVPQESERDRTFLVKGAGGDLILKIGAADEDPAYIDFQVKALQHLERVAPELPVPRVVPTRAGDATASFYESGCSARLLTFLPGRQMKEVERTPALLRDLGGLLGRLDRALAGFYHPAGRQPLPWDPRQASALRPLTAHLPGGEKALVLDLLGEVETSLLPALDRVRGQVIHMDATLDNTLVALERPDRICGLFDFGDMMHNALVVEPAVAAAEAMVEGGDPLSILVSVVAGYDQTLPLEEAEVELLFDLVRLRLAAGLTIIAARAALNDLDERLYHQAILAALEALSAKGRQRTTSLLRDACGFPEGRSVAGDNRSLLQRRRAVTLPGYEHFYDEPLHLVEGKGVYLYDQTGRRYIDAYNNVPHVGHCHPRVVNAVSRQMARLNINTRYLYGSMVDYAERLAATLPDGLDRCLFVSSGSEANDLAWRMAWAATGNKGALVTQGAYHGVTDLVASLSPCGLVRGEPAPAYLRTVRAPYALRMGGLEAAGRQSLADLDAAIASLAEEGLRPAALMLDTGLTSNGILDLPSGFLAAAVERVRAAGGLFVADEVQPGLGRCGETFWRFAAEGVVPDIVTIAKAVGNGFPLAATVTTEAIAGAFSDKYYFFSSCGGNPVACAAGLAVLDCLEREGLQENARRVGGLLKRGLEELTAGDPRVAEVRGRGLLLAVEFVRPDDPAGADKAMAKRVVESLRGHGILVGTEGPDGNVVKVRPPLVFQEAHAEALLAAFGEVLAEG